MNANPGSSLRMRAWAVLWLGAAILVGVAAGEEPQSSLVGSWTPVAIHTQQKDGTKYETFGPKPIGVLTFGSDGRFSLQFMRSDLPQFAGNDRMKGTAEENKAIVQGSISYFGTYTVDPTAKTLVLHVEGSLFPNWTGKDQKRSFTLSGDELTLTGIGTAGLPFVDELKRLK